jgi:multidrug resistance efflux pump
MSQREVSSFSGDYTTSSIIPLLKIGDAVVNGQVIARLTNTETQKLIDEYTAQLRKAEEELQLLRLGARDEEVQRSRNKVNELTARMNAATQDLQRLNEMLEKGLISKQDWEEARTDSLIWDSRLKAAENELDILLAGARPEELNAKEAEIERLNGQIAFHTGQMEQFEIKSTINGVVLNIDTGEVALEIADLDTMNAIITLSERDLADIGIGQQVKFRARSFPDRSFYGTVYRIDRKIMVDQNGDNVFNIACRVSNEDRILAPGMTGVANVYCGQRKIEELIYRKFFRIIRTEFWDWFDW